ncbi:LPS translocon maturation chaperone LptM [Salinisphaera orenii]|uniref:LPS translocon maturation chaperone LptM n=1 Tax=Salinisphaera orenii TaxID=856731 RepID=UPI003A4C74FA
MCRRWRQSALLMIAALLAGSVLAGCGQKGPLYQPRSSSGQQDQQSQTSGNKQSVPESSDSSESGATSDTAGGADTGSGG